MLDKLITDIFNNFWLMWVFVFFATCLMDYWWAVCVKHVTDKNAIASANTAVYFWVLAALVTVAYVKDPWFLIPFLIGTWVGTYVAVRMPEIKAWWHWVNYE